MEKELCWMMEQYQEKRWLSEECGLTLNGPMEPYEESQAVLFMESLQTEVDILACGIADAVCASPPGDGLPFAFLCDGYKKACCQLGKLYCLMDNADRPLGNYNISSQCTNLLWNVASSFARLIADYTCRPGSFLDAEKTSHTPRAAPKAQEAVF